METKKKEESLSPEPQVTWKEDVHSSAPNNRNGGPGGSKTYAVSGMDELAHSPHTLALLALLILTCVLLLGFDVIADVFQQTPDFPLLPMVVTSNGLTVFSLAVTIALGTHILPYFRMFSPLEGGEYFFAMQVSGYGLSISSMVLKVLLVMEISSASSPFHLHYHYGGLTVLGVGAILGHFLLVSSFLFYVMPQKTTASMPVSPALENNRSRLFRLFTPTPTVPYRPYKDILILVAIFASFLLSTSLSAAWPTSLLAAVLHQGTILAFILCGVIVIQRRGAQPTEAKDTAGCPKGRRQGSKAPAGPSVFVYSILRPPGSMLGAVTQVWANIFLLCAFFALARMHISSCLGRDTEPSGEQVVIWRMFSSASAAISISLHGILLHVAGKNLKKEEPLSRSVSPLPSNMFSDVSSSLEPYVVSVAAICTYIAIQVLTVVSYKGTSIRMLSAGLSVISPTATPPLSIQSYKDSGVLQLQGMLTLLLFMMPPLTHFQGRLLCGRVFAIWNPFGGNGEFLLGQLISWTCYGSATLTFLLHLSHPRWIHLFFISTLLLAAQIGVHISLHYFDPKQSVVLGTSSMDSTALAAMTSTQRTSVVIRTVFNGEFILAVVFSVVGVIVRAVCDVATFFPSSGTTSAFSFTTTGLNFSSLSTWLSSTNRSFPRAPTPRNSSIAAATTPTSTMSENNTFTALDSVLHLTNLLFLLSVPMAQFSMRQHLRLILDLDQRSTGYVLLITIGWTTYIGGCLAWAMQFMLYGVQGSHSITNHGFVLYYTCEGLFFSTPLLCLTCGFIFEMNKRVRATVRGNRVQTVLHELREWIGGHTDEQRCTPSEKDHLQHLLLELETKVRVADPTLSDTLSPSSKEASNGKQQDAEAVRDAAYYITVLTSLVSTSIFIVAALLVDSGPVIPITFGVTGLMVVTLSCCNLQYSYGHRLHVECVAEGMGAYNFFMPFRGGKSFIIQQAMGWSAFTLCWFLMLATSIEGSPSAGNLLVLAGTSSLAQVLIMNSIGSYDGTKAVPDNFIARSPEGLLAAATIAGTFFCSSLYEAASAARYKAAEEQSLLMSGATVQASSRVGGLPPVPVIMSAISLIVAVPMGLMSLQRQAQAQSLPTPANTPFSSRTTSVLGEDWIRKGNDDEDEDDEIDEPMSSSLEARPMQNAIWLAFSPPGFKRELVSSRTPTPQPADIIEERKKRYSSKQKRNYFAFSFGRILALFVVYLFPFVVFFLLYTYNLRLEKMFRFGVVALQSMGVLLALLLALPVVVPVLMVSSSFAAWCRQAYYFSCAWWMWSIPTMTVVGGLSPPLFVNTWGAWVWFFNMTVMCCLSTIPRLPFICFVVNTILLGFFIHFHLYTGWFSQHHAVHWGRTISDLFAVSLWIWYDTRYFSKPQINGRLYNAKVRRFFKKYVFYGAVKYFNIRVIRVEPYVIEEEKEKMGDQQPELSVDRRDPKNQYLFSFHPHGVFPGSSLYVPCSAVWEDLIGTNNENRVVTHAADVIFLCPFMRELPLCVGSLSVARRGIESSIKQGHSPLIITGGQSEMLLTQFSNTEMHLVCHHLGFIKLAMRHRLPLVPVLSFSECNIMDNVHLPKVQRWFVKRVGFPGVVMPHGFWYLPLPTHLPVALVVGHPIRPYPGREDPDDPSCVEEMRARYFNHLQTIFYAYRAEAGYPEMVLYLHNGIYDPGLRIPPPGEMEEKRGEKKTN